MRFEYRQWEKGIYEVFYLHDYNPIAKMFYSKSVGMVQKDGRMWISMKHPNLAAKTRKEISEMLAKIAQ